MKVETLEELVFIMKCKGKTPNCIGKDCITCRADFLFKYFNIELKEEYK